MGKIKHFSKRLTCGNRARVRVRDRTSSSQTRLLRRVLCAALSALFL